MAIQADNIVNSPAKSKNIMHFCYESTPGVFYRTDIRISKARESFLIKGLSSMEELTQEEVQRLFDYDKETGDLIWKAPPKGCHSKVGDRAGSKPGQYGRMVFVKGKSYNASTLVWLHCTGEFHSGRFIHMDGNPANTRIEKLKKFPTLKDGELTQEVVKELLFYEPYSGEFTWRVSSGPVNVGDTAGWRAPSGRSVLRLLGENYPANKIAWLYVYGYIPEKLAHISKNRADNSIFNLREVTEEEKEADVPTPAIKQAPIPVKPDIKPGPTPRPEPPKTKTEGPYLL
jgi:hypothetical protein